MIGILNFLAEDIGLSGGLLIAAILALVLGGGTKRRVLGLVLMAAAMPVSSRLATLPLDASTLAFEQVAAQTPGDAVVVYGAGVFADRTGGMWPSARSLERAAVGLALSKALNRPLVVSGGIVRPDLAAEAVVLSTVMQLPDDTILEAKARTTAENAQYVAEIARNEGWQSIILVTGRVHTRRALAATRTAGLPVAAVVDATRPRGVRAADFLPGVSGLAAWSPVFHEYAGILWYILSGRIDAATLVG